MATNTKAVGAAMRQALANKHAELYASLRRSSGALPPAPQVDAAQPAPVPQGHAGTHTQQVIPTPPSMNDILRSHRTSQFNKGIMR